MSYAPAAAILATPIGRVRVESDGAVVTEVRILGADAGRSGARDASLDFARDGRVGVLDEALSQLAAYFEGRLTVFDLPLKASTTPRGSALRQALVDVGYGETATYGAVAAAIGSSARAVGQACRTNPFPILVPCHRILSAGDRLGHYSAGAGPDTKRQLLTLEQAKGWLI